MKKKQIAQEKIKIEVNKIVTEGVNEEKPT